MGSISRKEIYHLALAKCMDPDLIHLPLQSICSQIVASVCYEKSYQFYYNILQYNVQAESMGIEIVKTLSLNEQNRRSGTRPSNLEALKKEAR